MRFKRANIERLYGTALGIRIHPISKLTGWKYCLSIKLVLWEVWVYFGKTK